MKWSIEEIQIVRMKVNQRRSDHYEGRRRHFCRHPSPEIIQIGEIRKRQSRASFFLGNDDAIGSPSHTFAKTTDFRRNWQQFKSKISVYLDFRRSLMRFSSSRVDGGTLPVGARMAATNCFLYGMRTTKPMVPSGGKAGNLVGVCYSDYGIRIKALQR